MSLCSYRRSPEHVCEVLDAAGLVVDARILREPVPDLHETMPQAYLMARRPAAS